MDKDGKYTDLDAVKQRWESEEARYRRLDEAQLRKCVGYPNCAGDLKVTMTDEERERQIAEVEEEIAEIVEDLSCYQREPKDEKLAAIYSRILAYPQERLAALKQGMKQ